MLGMSCLLMASAAHGRTLMGQAEALRLAFPDSATIIRSTLYLTETQAGDVQRRARARLDARVIPYYTGVTNGRTDGYAFFDTHMVRTMPETVMIVVNPDGAVKAVELLAFHEPDEYAPPERWQDSFAGRKLDDELWLKRGIRNVTGASLTSTALTAAVRRSLALWTLAKARSRTPR